MACLAGAVLAAVLCAAAWLVRFDRDRVFYPTMLIVIASYYVLFAVMGGDRTALLRESGIACGFIAAALIGFRINLWIVAAALAAHGLFDWLHPRLFQNDGVPGWWPAFCLAFDIGAALFLAGLLLKRGPYVKP